MFGLKLSGKRSSSAPLPPSPRAKLNSGKLHLEDILVDPPLLAAFKDFLTATLCQENLAALQAIEAFKAANKKPIRAFLAQYILDEFLSITAKTPVNVEATIRVQTVDSIQSVDDKAELERDCFSVVEGALTRLLVQDCLSRFMSAKDYEKYKTRQENLWKIFPANKLPSLQEYKLKLNQSTKYAPIPTMMPDLSMVEGKKGCCGSIECNNSTALRAVAVLLDAVHYADWIPDVDSVTDLSEQFGSFGSFLSTVSLRLSSGASMNLGVFQLVSSVHEGYVALETFGKGDAELSGVFYVRLSGERFSSCKVDFFLASKGKVKASAFVQSVLLGLNMSISTSVESKEADLAEELQFLKKL